MRVALLFLTLLLAVLPAQSQYVSESDSLALVAFYQATGGENWTNNTNWLTDQPVHKWYGVSAGEGGFALPERLQGVALPALRALDEEKFIVFGLQLSENNLVGKIPDALGDLRDLQLLDLAENQLEGAVPEAVSAIPFLFSVNLSDNELTAIGTGWPDFSDLFVENNRLTFEDIVPLAEARQEGQFRSTFDYRPQKAFGSPQTVSVFTGDAVSLQVDPPDDLVDFYEWTRGESFLGEGSGNVFSIEAVSQGDAGQYVVYAFYNPLEFEIASEPITLEVISPAMARSDSLALVALYQALGPDDLAGFRWLNGPVSNWIGVTTEKNYLEDQAGNAVPDSVRVTGLELVEIGLPGMIPDEIADLPFLRVADFSYNNLTGAVPETVTSLENLTGLFVSDNHLQELPDLSGMASLLNLYVDGNFLTFGDIEPNIRSTGGLAQAQIEEGYTFIYDRQGAFGEVQSYSITEGESLTLSFPVDGDNNVYQWYKNETAIAGATQATYPINQAEPGDEGFYQLVVTNTVAKELTLTSETASVLVIEPTVWPADSLALRELYLALDGPNWNDNDTWLNGPISSWTGVVLEAQEMSVEGQTFKALRVVKLSLSEMGLMGSLPDDIGALTALKTLDMSSNDIQGTIPAGFANLVNLEIAYLDDNELDDLNFAALAATAIIISIQELSVENNQLTFQDLLPLTFFDIDYTYAPQQLLSENTFVLLDEGDALALTTRDEAAEGNSYQWLKDDTALEEATDDTLANDFLAVEDQGTYRLQVTNPGLPDLTLESGDFFVIVNDNGVLADDSLALVALYQALDGPNWTSQQDADPDNDWLSGPVTGWQGVTVEEVIVQGETFQANAAGQRIDDLQAVLRVTGLDLSTNNLTGTLPAAVGTLSFLKDLVLEDNDLSGDLPEALGDFPLLRLLDLSSNQYEGTLPSFLTDLASLETLYLNNNSFSGSLPNTWNIESSLVDLSIRNNNLSGEIPSTLVALPLVSLSLSGNSLTGSIPVNLAENSGLVTLNLSSNELSGEIPTGFGNSRLTFLGLSNNSLSGALPTDLGNLDGLQYLLLSFNGFTGSIPSAWGEITSLLQLDLRHNALSGEIPTTLADLPQLQLLKVGANNLTGAVPSGFANSTSLQTLMVNGNALSTLPDLSAVASLLILDVSNNAFTFDALEANLREDADFSYSYDPQASFGASNTISVEESDAFTLSFADPGGANTTYQWYRGEELIPRATAASYRVEAATLEDAGTYYLEATSPSLGLTLQSEVLTVGVTAIPIIELETSLVDFDAVRVGASQDLTLGISNTGSAALVLSALSFFEQEPVLVLPIDQTTEPPFLAPDVALPLTISPGETYPLTIRFVPTEARDYPYQLDIESNAGKGTTFAELFGFGTEPVLRADAEEILFEDLRVGETATQQVTLLNNGSAILAVENLKIVSAEGGAAFTVEDLSFPILLSTDAGEVRVDLQFAPGFPGLHAGWLVIESDAPSSPDSIKLGGTGVAPEITLTAQTLTFGEVLVGDSSSERLFIKNTGSAPLTVSDVSISQAGPFAIVGEPVGEIAAGDSLEVEVSFKPESPDDFVASLTVSSDGFEAPVSATERSVSLEGTGIAPEIALTAQTLSFGEVLVGESSSERLFIKNTGSAPLTVSDVSIAGSGPYTVVGEPVGEIAAGDSLEVEISFAPETPDDFLATLTVSSDGFEQFAATERSVSLEGTGIAPEITLTAQTLAFGEVIVGESSSERLFIKNTGSAPLTVSDVSISQAGPFAIVGQPVGEIAAGDSLEVEISFAPETPDDFVASLTVSSDGFEAPVSTTERIVSLEGTGVAPEITLTAQTLAFGEVLVGESSSERLFIKNTGSAPLTVSDVSIAGSGPFTVVGESVGEIAAGDSLEVEVSFAPETPDDFFATLTVSSDGFEAPVSATERSVSLEGTGIAPEITLTAQTLVFGEVLVGESSSQNLFIKNTGSAPLTVSDVSIAGSGPFAVVGEPVGEIAAGDSLEVEISFTPESPDDFVASLTVSSDGFEQVAATERSVSLEGMGVAPEITLTTQTLAFGEVLVGESSSERLFIKNTGSAPLTISDVSIAGSGPFTVVGEPVGEILAGDSLEVEISFAPETPDDFLATLIVLSDGFEQFAATERSVSLEGTGVAPEITLTAQTLSFGEVLVGESSLERLFIKNTGSAPLTVSDVSINEAGPFSIVGEPVGEIAAGDSLEVEVSFTPETPDDFNATLTVSSDGFEAPVSATERSVSLEGTGIAPEITLTAQTLSFGEVLVGESSFLNLFIKNTGSAPLTVSDVSINEAGPFSIIGQPVGEIAAGDSLEVEVSFAPETPDDFLATLTVSSDGFEATVSATERSVSLEGTGVAPEITLTVQTLTFGEVLVGESSSERMFIKNTGSAPLTVSDVSIAGSGPFTVVGESVGEIAAGDSLEVEVSFAPETPDDFFATLTVSSDGFEAPVSATERSVSLEGTGIAPEITLTAQTLAFGEVLVGESSSERLFIKNTGNAPLTVSGVSIAGSGPYTVVGEPVGEIAAGDSLEVEISFAPETPDDFLATLTVSSDGFEQFAATERSVSLEGTGIAPEITLTAQTLSFGEVLVGESSSERLFIKNTGSAPLTVSDVSINEAGPFAIVGQPVGEIAAGDSLEVEVSFTPESPDDFNATLTVSSDGFEQLAATERSVSLEGTGIAPEITLTAQTLAFGEVLVGESSSQNLFIKNTGSAPLTVSDVSISEAGPFSIIGEPVGEIAAGDSLEVEVSFAPETPDDFLATLTVSSDGFEAPVSATERSVSLEGTGVAPEITLTTQTLVFGEVLVGESSSQNLFIKNTGSAPLTVSDVSIAGSGPFTVVGEPVGEIAAGDSLEVEISFTPESPDDFNATLTVSSDGFEQLAATERSVSLEGTGIAPEITLTAQTLSFGEVLVGESSSQNLFIKNTGSAPLTVSDVSIAGSGPFTVVGEPVGEIAAGDSLEVEISFTPESPDDFNATLTVSSDGFEQLAATERSVSLEGTGIAPEITLTAQTLSFGEVLVGESSLERLFIKNTGSAPLTVSAVSIAGSGPFTVVGEPVGELLAGDSLGVEISFTPGTPDDFLATLTVSSDGFEQFAATERSVSLEGTGIAPEITLTAQTLTFGEVLVGESSSERLFIKNTGSAPLTVSDVSIAGSGPFTVVGEPVGEIAAGDSLEVTVSFAPEMPDEFVASLTVSSDGFEQVAATERSVSLEGTGVAPEITLTAQTLVFGEVLVGESSSERLFIKNTGSAPLTVSDVSIADSGPFTVVGEPVGEIAAGDSLEVEISFTPETPDDFLATLTVSSDGFEQLAATERSVSLEGTGIAPEITLSPASLNFENVRVGESSSQNLFIKNTGSAPLTVSDVSIADSGPFTVMGEPVGEISAGDSLEVTVSFAPETPDDFTGAVVVTSDAFSGNSEASLRGTGIQPGVGLDPLALAFGEVVVGSTSASQMVELTNTGTALLSITEATFLGEHPDQFTLVSGGFAGEALAIDAGSTHLFEIAFAPSGAAPATADFVITSDATSSPDTVALMGQGIAPAVGLDARAVVFAATPVGTSAEAEQVTLTNTGSAPLTLTSIALTGEQAGQFSILAGGEAGTVEVGASRVIEVGFLPLEEAVIEASLAITSDAATSVDQVALSGVGYIPVATADSLALVALYQSLNGETWQDATGWLAGQPLSQWFGIRVEIVSSGTSAAQANTPLRRVTGLNLASNGLGGEMPAGFGEQLDAGGLAFLDQLDLSGNTIGGNLPTEIGNLALLDTLDLSQNAFQDTIPATWGNLGALKKLSLGNNQLRGAVPQSFSNLSNLKALALESNSLEKLPDLSNLPLESLSVSGNDLPLSDLEAYSELEGFTYGDQQPFGEPQTITARDGSAVMLTAIAEGADTFQWYFAGSEITGATSESYTIDPVSEADEGAYVLKVTNDALPGLVLESEPITLVVQTGVLLADSLALVKFYAAAGGTGWNNIQSPWLQAETPISAWEGITLGTDSNDRRRVIGLELPDRGLTTTDETQLAVALGELDALETLRLDANALTGALPASLANLPLLETLDLSGNSFDGALPAAWGGLANLVTLKLRSNDLSGPLPVEYANLGRLETLDLGQNALQDSIPRRYGQLAFLRTLRLDDNELDDPLPDSLGELSDLRILDLHRNDIRGNLPTALRKLANLEFLDLSHNRLEGEIPSPLWNLTAVRELYLHDNQLSGTLSPLFEDTEALEVFYLQNNELTGAVPDEWANMASLRVLRLENNQLTGLPDFSARSTLDTLRAEANALTFESLEPNIGQPFALRYIPQETVPAEEDAVVVDERAALDLSMTVGGVNNQYQWYFEGAPLAGATGSSLAIPSAATTDAGAYYLEITNTLVPDLTLVGDTITVTVIALPFAQLNTAALVAPNTKVGAQAVAGTVAVTNTGSADLILTDLQIVGAGFSIAAAGPLTVLPQATENIEVTFVPTGPQLFEAELVVTYAGEVPTNRVALSGTGLAPQLVVDATLDFGSVFRDSTRTDTLYLHNRGDASLVVSSIAINAPGTSAFSIVDGAAGGTVAIDESLGVAVSFTPSAGGLFEASLSIQSPDLGTAASVGLAGTGLTALLVYENRSELDFGNVARDSTRQQSVTLVNDGDAPMRILSITPTGADADRFSVLAGGEVGLLAGGQRRTVEVAFTPDQGGEATATLAVTTTALTPTDPLPLRGVGLVPSLTAQAPTLAFNNQLLDAEAFDTVRVENDGVVPVRLSNASISGDAGFRVVTLLDGLELAPDSITEIVVGFQPAEAVAYEAALSVPSTAGNSPLTVALTGTGALPQISRPDLLDFGNTPVADGQVLRTLEITNPVDVPLTLQNVRFAEGSASAFTLEMVLPADTTLLQNQPLQLTLGFDPAAEGLLEAGLVLESNAAQALDTLKISGVGTVPQVTFAEDPFLFPDTPVGASGPDTLRFVNTGLDTLRIASVALLTADSLHFAIVAGGGAEQVAPGENYELALSFTPVRDGRHSTVLRFASNYLGGLELALEGEGLVSLAQLDSSAVRFGTTSTGGFRNAQVTLTNPGEANLIVEAAEVVGDGAALFRIQNALPDPFVLAPAAQFTFDLQFRPVADGVFADTLRLVSNAAGGVLELPLQGRASRPAIAAGAPVVHNATGGNLQITATLPADFAPETRELHFRRSGAPAFTVVNLAAGAAPGTFQATLPNTAVGARGVEYFFRFVSGSTEITVPAASPAENPNRIRVRLDSLQAGTSLLANAYRMFTVPLDLANADVLANLRDDFGGIDQERWRVLRFDPTQDAYEEVLGEGTALAPGEAYWGILGEALPFDVGQGVSVATETPYELALAPGWNQVGSPFAFAVAWDSISGIGSVEAPIGYDGTEYVPLADRILRPWEGYFVFNTAADTVRLSVPPSEAPPRAGKSDAPASVAAAHAYSLRLEASLPDYDLHDTQNYLGFSAAATDTRDRYDYREPPSIGRSVQLRMQEEDGSYAVNYKALNEEGHYWDFEVTTHFPDERLPLKKNAEIRLEELGSRPDGFQMYLLDLDEGYLVTLAEDQPVRVQLDQALPLRKFRLILGTEAFAAAHSNGIPLEAVEFALLPNYPNPFNPQTQIPYQLGKQTSVTLEVYNLLGQRVVTLVQQEQAAGRYTVTWAGVDAGGRPVASGVYFYRIRAGGFTDTKKMILVK